MFDGKSLDGWELFGGESGDWKVVDGVLTSDGKCNRLVFTKETFDDFDVLIECRLDNHVNSGIYVRTNKSETSGVGYVTIGAGLRWTVMVETAVIGLST